MIHSLFFLGHQVAKNCHKKHIVCSKLGFPKEINQIPGFYSSLFKKSMYFSFHIIWYFWGENFNIFIDNIIRVERSVSEHSRQAKSKGRAPLFLVSKQNLNASSSWCIWCTNSFQNPIRNEKVMLPQSRGGHELEKNKPQDTTKLVS
jgi:hypothetical protein